MTIEIWLMIALFVSVAINVFLIWFAREQSTRVTYVSQNIGDLVELISSYRDHLKAIYQLDTYYGDNNIKFLFDHTRSLITIIEQEYSDVTSLTDPLEVEFEEEVDVEEKIEESKPYGENVFYAGSRERNT
tara:strand:- start:321 stop:713 length:393 start_codon:yes stop_codon:yes gene_type:complete